MILGVLLMLAGCLLVIENKRIALYTGNGHRYDYFDFSSSAARQNVAIIGGLLFVAGFGGFLFL